MAGGAPGLCRTKGAANRACRGAERDRREHLQNMPNPRNFRGHHEPTGDERADDAVERVGDDEWPIDAPIDMIEPHEIDRDLRGHLYTQDPDPIAPRRK